MSPRNIFAFTPPGADFPEFISVNRGLADAISVMVRSPKSSGGAVGQMNLTPEKARELGLALIQATNSSRPASAGGE
jgi:hypothetical protein